MTTMSMFRLIIRRALSTTTIVPSSRYATPWLYSLPSLRMHDRFQRVRQLVDVEDIHTAQLRDLVQIEVVGNDLALERATELDQLQIHLTHVGEVDVGDHDVDAGHLLDLL